MKIPRMLRCRLESSFHLLEPYSIQPRVVRCAKPGAWLACGKCKREEDQVRGTAKKGRRGSTAVARRTRRGGAQEITDHRPLECRGTGTAAGRARTAGHRAACASRQPHPSDTAASHHRRYSSAHTCIVFQYSNSDTYPRPYQPRRPTYPQVPFSSTVCMRHALAG